MIPGRPARRRRRGKHTPPGVVTVSEGFPVTPVDQLPTQPAMPPTGRPAYSFTGRSVKSVRETLCVAMTAVQHGGHDPRDVHVPILQEFVDELDVLRPLGPDGVHGTGERCTPWCGCERRFGREATPVESILLDALKIQRTLDDTANQPDAYSLRLELIGRLTGLRTALCHLHGWEPELHADKEGKADDLVQEFWRTHPGPDDACSPGWHFTPHVGCVLR